MATDEELRPSNRPADAGSMPVRLLASRPRPPRGVRRRRRDPMRQATSSRRLPSSTPPSGPRAATAASPPRGVKVELGDSGYAVQNATGKAALSSEDAAGGELEALRARAVRSTPFGSETVVVTPTRAEQFLTVRERQGERTWRWRLGTGKHKPKLSDDGSVLPHGRRRQRRPWHRSGRGPRRPRPDVTPASDLLEPRPLGRRLVPRRSPSTTPPSRSRT